MTKRTASSQSRRRPAVCKLLGKMRTSDVSRMNDANLKNLHDLTLIVLVECQGELCRRGRGAESGVQILSTRPPYCDKRAAP